jgi:hypothetical protein
MGPLFGKRRGWSFQCWWPNTTVHSPTLPTELMMLLTCVYDKLKPVQERNANKVGSVPKKQGMQVHRGNESKVPRIPHEQQSYFLPGRSQVQISLRRLII